VAILCLIAGEPGRGAVWLFDSFGRGTANNPRLDSGGSPVAGGFRAFGPRVAISTGANTRSSAAPADFKCAISAESDAGCEFASPV
jgi:hypothetical protein